VQPQQFITDDVHDEKGKDDITVYREH